MSGERIISLKQAAKRIVNTLTFADRVAIVTFASEAKTVALNNKYLFPATDENKETLLAAIYEIQVSGSTNFLDAFEKTFQILEDSYQQEFNVFCSGGVSGNTAILFLTDGVATSPESLSEEQRDEATVALVQDGLTRLETQLGRAPYLFTYSVSDRADAAAVGAFPKRLACETTTNGVWSQISESRQILDALSSYYRVFTLGLSEGNNADFTAWVEVRSCCNRDRIGE